MVPAMPSLRELTTRIWSAAAALLLAVVLAHAVAPMPQDHGRARGSAFSAATQEVSLKSGTAVSVAKELVRLEPPLPRRPVKVVSVRGASATVAIAVARGPVPAAHDPALHPLSPRAPPFA